MRDDKRFFAEGVDFIFEMIGTVINFIERLFK